jgi:hypothetical protein
LQAGAAAAAIFRGLSPVSAWPVFCIVLRHSRSGIQEDRTMSLSALRNTTPAVSRGFGAIAGVETQGQPKHDDASWRRGADHDRSDARTTATSAVALEPHWLASIDNATD